jgi:hypothetical protein
LRTRWLLAASLACVLGLAAWAFVLSRELNEAGRELVDTTAFLAQMSSELETTRADADLLVDVLAVLRGDGLRQVELRGAGPERGRVFVSARGMVLLVDGLEMPAPGRVYQAWVGTREAAPVTAGTFEVNPFGMATLVGRVPLGAGVVTVTVTSEPAGGSPAPTAPPRLTGP